MNACIKARASARDSGCINAINKVTLIADIEKAFLMVSGLPEDRDVLRFLWHNDTSSDIPKEIMI